MSQATDARGGLDTVTGTITQAGTNSDGSPAFKFIYKYKGEDYESPTIVPGTTVRNFGSENVAAWSDKYRVGSSQTVLVHPDYPSKGFLEAGPTQEYVTNIAFLSLFGSTRQMTMHSLQKALRMAK
jgi:hypothetical protein